MVTLTETTSEFQLRRFRSGGGRRKSAESVQPVDDHTSSDALNRLVSVSNAAGQVIAQYTYNAMGYRITETYPQGGNGIAAGTVNNIYYDSSWQAIETRTDGTASSNVTSQTVWSAAYINAVVLQDTYSAGVIQPNSRLYFLQDANWNTTAIVGLVSGSWQITQRYVYSPYGTITVLTSDWSTTGETPLVSNLYQGMTLDPVTGLCYARNRNYSPSLCRWINQDPAGFINGANMYQFVMSDPVEFTDPLGRSWYNPQIWGWVQTTEGTFRDAVGIDGGAVAGAFWTGAVQGLGQEFGSDLYIYSQWAQALNQRLQDIGGPIMDGVNLLGRASPIGVQGWYGTLDNNAGIEVGSGAGIQGTTTWGGSTTGSIDGNGQTLVGQSTGTDRVGIDTGGVVSAPFEIPDSPWGGAILFNSGMAAQELEQLAKALRGWLGDFLPDGNDSGLPSNYVTE